MKRLSIESLTEELKLAVLKNFDFEKGDVSELFSLFAILRLSTKQCNAQMPRLRRKTLLSEESTKLERSSL